MLNYTNTLLLLLKLMFSKNTTSLVWAHAELKEIKAKALCKLKMKNFGAVVLQLAKKKTSWSQLSQDMEETLTLKLSLQSQYPILFRLQIHKNHPLNQLLPKKFQFKSNNQSALRRLSSEWMINILFPLLKIKLKLLKLMVLITSQLNKLQLMLTRTMLLSLKIMETLTHSKLEKTLMFH